MPLSKPTERRSRFRTSLRIESWGVRLSAAAIVTGIYVIAFAPLYRLGGVGVAALVIFPVVIVGWIYGSWRGLLAGILSVPLNALLLGAVGEPGWQMIVGEGGLEGSALVIVLGAVIGLLRDLSVRLDRHFTEWRVAEGHLRESEDRYQVLFERSRDPIYVTSEGGEFRDANAAFLGLFGYTGAEILDLGLSSLYVSSEDYDSYQEEITGEGLIENFEVRLQDKRGEILTGLIAATAKRGPDGEIIHVQGSVRDITAQKAIEELAQQRTVELENSVAELEAFTYSVSHDLRTHLVTVGGFSSELLGQSEDLASDKVKDYIGRIAVATRRMDTFLQDLLAYSRITQTEITASPVDLGSVTEQVLENLAGVVAERDTQVVVSPELLSVQGDEVTLVQVIQNLVSNAIKFVPSERVPLVTIHAESGEGNVRLWVEDNGIGIEATDFERVFLAFESLHQSEFPGTGVGLAIVRKGVERMGGRVGIESEPSSGSRFWIELPSS